MTGRIFFDIGDLNTEKRGVLSLEPDATARPLAPCECCERSALHQHSPTVPTALVPKKPFPGWSFESKTKPACSGSRLFEDLLTP